MERQLRKKDGERRLRENLETIERQIATGRGGEKKNRAFRNRSRIFSRYFSIRTHTCICSFRRKNAGIARLCERRAETTRDIAYFKAGAIVRVRFEGQTVVKCARKRSVWEMELIFRLESLRDVLSPRRCNEFYQFMEQTRCLISSEKSHRSTLIQ